MHENDCLNGCLNYIELGFVEREATPRLLMKLGIQLHLASLSLSNTISILEIFGVSRARFTIHNWVHKVELQPEASRCPGHVAVNETGVRLNDEQYWLYAAVDPETNELPHTALEPTINRGIAHNYLLNSARNTILTTPCFFQEFEIPFRRLYLVCTPDLLFQTASHRISVLLRRI